MRTTAATSSALFAELSDRFGELVHLLAEVSFATGSEEPVSGERALELIDAYRRTGRPELLEKLEQLGVVLRPGMKDDNDLVH